ncbi:MAG TPA: hypothetical protein VEY30_09370 [Myxococcaceae bacterium]|nr:hypothetical protein [Myxococcaceae bacterium]
MLYPIRGVSEVQQVDPDVFTLRYFAACMSCGFCNDSCCSYGADVAIPERDRILAQAESLKALVNYPADQWFTDDVKYDSEYEGGAYVRARAVDGRCVFLNRKGRGCLLHAWAVEGGRDYHRIKPMVCWLFPVTFDRGVLRPNFDVKDGLVCVDQGPTLYRSAREELRQRFGEVMIAELDRVEREVRPLVGGA